jgi:FtsH-binding integral membrane protein
MYLVKITQMESMLYLKSNKATMKIKLQIMRIAFLVMLGLAILFTSLALNRTPSVAQEATATPAIQVATTITAAEAQDDVGSTDGIMIMAVLIVLIVIIPILLKRQVWANGKDKNKIAPR